MKTILIFIGVAVLSVGTVQAANEVPFLKEARTCVYFLEADVLETSKLLPIGAVDWRSNPAAAWFYFDGDYTVSFEEVTNPKEPSGMTHSVFRAPNSKLGITIDCSPFSNDSENYYRAGINRLKCTSTIMSASPHNSFPKTIYGNCRDR